MKDKDALPKREEERLYASKEDALKDQVDFKKTSKSYYALLRYKAVYYGILLIMIVLILAIVLGVILN